MVKSASAPAALGTVRYQFPVESQLPASAAQVGGVTGTPLLKTMLSIPPLLATRAITPFQFVGSAAPNVPMPLARPMFTFAAEGEARRNTSLTGLPLASAICFT